MPSNQTINTDLQVNGCTGSWKYMFAADVAALVFRQCLLSATALEQAVEVPAAQQTQRSSGGILDTVLQQAHGAYTCPVIGDGAHAE
jgi:hypothetical protein